MRSSVQENGHQQMLCQAAAMLVSFPTLVAAKFNSVALLPFLGQGLAVARPADATFLESRVPFIGRHIIRVIINGILRAFWLHVHRKSL